MIPPKQWAANSEWTRQRMERLQQIEHDLRMGMPARMEYAAYPPCIFGQHVFHVSLAIDLESVTGVSAITDICCPAQREEWERAIAESLAEAETKNAAEGKV